MLVLGMANSIPTVDRYMTASPHAIGPKQALSAARLLMLEHGIRHVPVVERGHLAGLLTERDLRLVEALPGLDLKAVRVQDAMARNVYSVSPETPLDDVLETMAEHKYGSAVVMRGDTVVGIFTTVDVCRAFVELLREETPRES